MKNQKGITLIALIIAVIVLIILAGITIRTLNKKNGVIEKAKNAKNETEQSDSKEREEIEKAKNEIKNDDDATEHVSITKTYLLTINYVYANGEEAAPSYKNRFRAGEKYGPISSPKIVGYNPDQASITSSATGMPANPVEVNVVYSAVAPKETYTLKINYVCAENQVSPHTQLLTAGSTYSVKSPTISGYVSDKEIVSGIMPSSNVTVTVTYDVDIIGNSYGSDGIPDKYQAVVTFIVVNGTWNGVGTIRSTIVTLRDASGNLSESGSYTLTAADIPTGTTTAGYGNGSWSKNPLYTVIRNNGASFTLTYSMSPDPGPDPGPGPIIPDLPIPLPPTPN